VLFTGAGISTAAGIPDYRGPQGVWTLAAKGEERSTPSVALSEAVPTFTHRAIAELMRRGIVKHVISQNVDGMHRKTGLELKDLSELHGNINLEVCDKCDRAFLRDYHVRTATHHLHHETGNFCLVPECGGRLKDNIVNFGEPLRADVLGAAFAHSAEADVHVVLGSSLTVRPACQMPFETWERKGKLAIVNLQRTGLDDKAAIRIHATADMVMQRVMAHLSIPVPEFVLHRRAIVWRSEEGVCVWGLDSADDQVPSTIFRRAVCTCDGRDETQESKQHGPFHFQTPIGCSTRLSLEPFGYYNEPNVVVELPVGCDVVGLDLCFTPANSAQGWQVTPNPDLQPPKLCSLPLVDDTAEPEPEREQQPASGGADFSGWFAVEPLASCPHLETGVDTKLGPDTNPRARCKQDGCGNIGENMVCLQCGVIMCGRHVRGHMKRHGEETGHPLVMGFVDLSFWCYSCDAYIKPDHPKLAPFYRAYHEARFGAPPPMAISMEEE